MKILSWLTGEVIFESKHKTIKATICAAISRANLFRANLFRANLSGADLSRANLSGADLSGANLSGADLSGANLSSADLSRANLFRADLSRANLSRADLFRADLSRANLSSADLSRANLFRADLSRANLFRADLSRANLFRADLSGANLSGIFGLYFQICPKGGAFTAWKKASNCIVQLKIPAWAMRTSSIVGRKCRAEFAIVVDIRDKNQKQIDSVSGDYSPETIYEIGKIMKPDSYDSDPRIECAHGIHFFMTREEAEAY